MTIADLQLKRCADCGEVYNVSFFEITGRRSVYASTECGTEPVCIGCKQTARDAKKQSPEGRWAVKVRDTIRRHARALNRTPKELDVYFGWSMNRMVRDAQLAYARGCAYCERAFVSLPDVTLDILNPASLAYYPTNANWACATCNRQKSTKSAAEWGARLADWRQWNAWHQANKGGRQRSLFDLGLIDFSH